MMMLSQSTFGMAVILTLFASVFLANATVLRGTDKTADINSPPEEDTFLYYGNVAWADLPEDVKDAWDDLGFGAISWTVQGMNENMEEASWSDLDQEDRAFAEIIGFTEDTWDCQINHNNGYDWKDLKKDQLTEYFETIEYDEDMWEEDEDEDAAIHGENWDDIDAETQAALEEICWTQDLWDSYGTEPDGFLYYGTFAWTYVEKHVRDAWEAIGFTNAKKSWTQQGWDEAIESKSWFSLSSGTRANASIVGFTEDTWDCHINHYDDYDWEELVAYDLTEYYNLTDYFEIIGYTQDIWEGDNDPDVDDQDWDEIKTEVQAALEEICWTEDLWDNYA
eukprot:scaffold33622_cov51-Attheya_sp.AAC.1